MRHRRKGRKLSRKRDQRKALLKNLAANLILKEKIITTEAKAKEVQPFVEKLITKSKPPKVAESDLRDKSAKGVVLTNGQGSPPKEGQAVSGRGDLSSIRYLARYLPEKARKKITEEIGPRYKERAGGYTRIIKLGLRKTDGAKMAIIELVK